MAETMEQYNANPNGLLNQSFLGLSTMRTILLCGVSTEFLWRTVIAGTWLRIDNHKLNALRTETKLGGGRGGGYPYRACSVCETWVSSQFEERTIDCPLKDEGKTLEEAYYTQFGGPFQGGGYRATAPGFYQRNNANPSYQEQRKSLEDTLSKFMGESAKRHEENSNLIKEI
ncbi:hypothetical protein Tco_0248350 [Tanacetum coccineum]